jgi:hypothetical protein
MTDRIRHLGVLGSFLHLDPLVEAAKGAAKKGYEVRDVFSPVPIEEIEKLVSPRRSPVRFVTFFGGLIGMIGGFALAIITAMIWDIIVGGKPVTNHVPFVVVGFELLVLIGALSTFLAVLVFSRLPYRRFPGPAYRPEFSKDQFGLWLTCPDEKCDDARQFLAEAGAEKIRKIEVEKKGGKR